MKDKAGRRRGPDGRFLKASASGGDDCAPRPGPARAGAKAGAGKQKAALWTRERETIFFRELATVCNVAAALRAAGLARAASQVYERRKRDPEFRAGWDEAIAESYAMLELEMLERSRFGDRRGAPKSEKEARLRSIPSSLALQLLKLHQGRMRSRAPAAQRPLRGSKLRDELEARLAEIARRLGDGG
jgi:hypothetical protein